MATLSLSDKPGLLGTRGFLLGLGFIGTMGILLSGPNSSTSASPGSLSTLLGLVGAECMTCSVRCCTLGNCEDFAGLGLVGGA